MRNRGIVIALAGMVVLPAGAAGQSLERDIERLAESIAARAERMAATVERQATMLAARIEREFAGRSRSRDYERDELQQQGMRSRLDTTITLSADAVVDLSLVSGEIIVTGWDRREARISAFSERGRLEWDASPSRLTLEVRSERDNWGRGRYGETRYEVSVPRGVRLMTRSTSGDISIRGAGGDVEANSTSGTITVVGAGGRTKLSTISGDIEASGARGDVDAGTVSGSIDIRDVDGDLQLSSTSGDLSAMQVRSSDVEMSTTSGEVSYEGSFAAEGRYEFSSHSGNIDLVVPESINARFSVQTYSGSIDSAFPITLQPGSTGSRARRGRDFDFTVGTGGPRIIAESFSGNVEIRKRR
ncbi:MAG: DUF4097 family beta strand repeat-containing protein [Gemmatimonadota bacterium]